MFPPRPYLALVPLLALGGISTPTPAADPFTYRGYYFILSRNPGYGLDDYRRILDCMAADRANTLILWIGGGFPSRRHPETWDYNQEHRNCRENFAGALIDQAHGRGIRVLLGLTPFAYDGVNRHGAAHPELGATDASGKPAVTGGIHSLGRGLCPSKPASREFMRSYCRELFDELYPNADGFFLEHSDYGTCQCASCAGSGYLRQEWQFVESLAAHVWGKKPEALMMINPRYAELGVEYDRRYIVFLAPHNMRGADRVLRNPRVFWSGYWDTGALFRDFCLQAAEAGYEGVMPSMENFTYEHPWAFDARWGPPGSAGWNDLLVRVTRASFREHSTRPDLSEMAFRQALREEFFGAGAPDAFVDDLLTLHRVLDRWEGWTFRGGVVRAPQKPLALEALDPKARAALESVTLPDLRALRAVAAASLGRMAEAFTPRSLETLEKMASISIWALKRWDGMLPEGMDLGGMPRDPGRGLAMAGAARPASFPHYVWAACDFEGETPDYGWFGSPEKENIPSYPGNATALRGQPAKELAAVFAGINPVPGPRMGKSNRVSFRYFLRGARAAQVQHFNLTREDNHHVITGGLEEGKWSDLTLDFSAGSRRNDGSAGAMSEGDRMDDLKVFVGRHGDGRSYEVILDDIVLHAEDPALPPDPEPFPHRIILLAAFDTGEKEKYWPGDLEIVERGLPAGAHWRAARAVPRKDDRGKVLRVGIEPPRPVGERTRLRFRYHLRGASSMVVQIFDLTVMDNRHVRLAGLTEGAWDSAKVDFSRDSRRNDGSEGPFTAGNRVDDLFFLLEAAKGADLDLLVDDVVLYDGARDG